MDYDDNDFQSQDLHLGGEERTEFSPVIRPFALPRFDFDDNLQGHLRFDSLVETEVFLGIESQEDNHWIEDFSRGSSGIEFSPPAVESCSISRRNNAWSEATSSESVEMLLKSVGQAEMIPGETINNESAARDDEGSLMKQMDPALEMDNRIFPKLGGPMDSEPILPSSNFLGCSQPNETVKGSAIEIDDRLQTHGGESSSCKSSGNVSPRTAGENSDLPVAEFHLLGDGKADVSQNEVRTSVHNLPVNRVGDFSAVELQSNNILTSGDIITATMNVTSGIGELDSQEVSGQFGNKKDDISCSNNYDAGKEDCNMNQTLVDNQRLADGVESATNSCQSALNAVSGVGSCPERNVAESMGKHSGEEPSAVILEEPNMQIPTDRKVHICSSIPVHASSCEVMGLCKDEETDGPDKDVCIDLPVTLEGDSSSERRHVRSNNVGSCAIIEGNMDSDAQHNQILNFKKDGNPSGSAHRTGSENVVSSYETSIPLLDDHKALNHAGSGVSLVGDVPCSTSVCLSPDFHDTTRGTEISNDLGDCSGSGRKDSYSEVQVAPSTLNDSVPICEKGEESSLMDKSSVESQGVGSILTDVVIGSSSIGISSSKDEVIISKSESKLPAGQYSESGVALDDGISLPSQDGASSPPLQGLTKEVIDNKCNELLEGRSDNMDKKEETALEMSAESSLSSREDFSKENDSHGVISRGKNDVVTEHLVHETVIQPPFSVESNEVGNHDQVAVNKVPQEVSAELVGCSTNDTAEEYVRSSHEVASLETSVQIATAGEALPVLSSPKDSYHEDKQTSQVSADGNGEEPCGANSGGNGSGESEKPNCGSPTVISCVGPQQEDQERQEINNGSADQNPAVSEVNCGCKEGCIPSPSSKGNDGPRDDRSFTFEVTPIVDLTEREPSGSWQPFSTIQAGQITGAAGGSSLSQMELKVTQDTVHGNITSDTQVAHSKSTARKTRRTSGKATGKESGKKANLRKEVSPAKQSERGDNTCTVSRVSSMTSQIIKSEGLIHYGHVDHIGTSGTGAMSVGTSSLPDLNALASTSVVFQQPFTDMQQLQLRAQIFVYGSLILGAAPDEACMVTAFGTSDGGRSIWENAWRACVERVHNQSPHPNNSETPLQSRSGARVPDSSNKHGALQSKVISTTVGRGSNKVTPTSVVALSSPLWSISSPNGVQPSNAMPKGAVVDYHPALSPLHAFQTPPLRNYVGHTSWLSQSPLPVPWIASQQTSALNASARLPSSPITETVRLTPVRESSVPHSSVMKPVSLSPLTQSGASGSALVGTSATSDSRKGAVSPASLADLKRKKKKKSSVSEDSSPISLPSQNQIESVPATFIVNRLSTPVATMQTFTAPTSSLSNPDTIETLVAVSPTSAPLSLKTGNTEQNVALSEETLNKVKEARLQAEEAAAHASAAVSHSQRLWTQLDNQKNSGLVPDVEAALASAAVAVAASASIAKAAAAAAKIASNAALQAKLMADEALVASVQGNFSQSSGTSVSNSVSNLGKGAASVPDGLDGTSSASSIIIAAREAARRKVEAASAASKQAENFDALVKAAELVADAVSQAGKIVAMGKPLPLSQLVEAGPVGCWNLAEVAYKPAMETNKARNDQLNSDGIEEGPNKYSEGQFEMIENETSKGRPSTPRNTCRVMVDGHRGLVDGIVCSVTNSEAGIQESSQVSNSAKPMGVIPESNFGVNSSAAENASSEFENALVKLNEGSIKEGSLVEVFKDDDAHKASWFLANVLSLKEGKAFVCYTDEGLGLLQEWVALNSEGDEAPIVRIARPITTTTHIEGTRKRQRAALGDYTWSVGDRVDAWIKDCWREGVVAEKHKEDETAFTISFPGQGETSVIRAWHLRPTLIWVNGEWIEASSSRENMFSSLEVDARQEKRPRLASHAVEAKGKDRLSKSIDTVEYGKPEDSGSLALSANDKVFNVGKTSKDGIKPNRPRTVQGSLRKEGPGVIFGVPKPGKKRKFMEVSKHYIAEQSGKTNEVSDSMKLAKFTMSQGSGFRGASGIDLRDKRAAESKPKAGKVPNISGRNATHRSNLLNSSVSISRDGNGKNNSANVEDSNCHDENVSSKESQTEFGSIAKAKGESGGPFLFSSSACPADAPPKKGSNLNAKSESTIKGKHAPSVGKLARIEEEKSTSEAIEPRRSNRRIQPTSRLLEGLQSSLTISKIPSTSHDRVHKSQNRSLSRSKSSKI